PRGVFAERADQGERDGVQLRQVDREEVGLLEEFRQAAQEGVGVAADGSEQRKEAALAHVEGEIPIPDVDAGMPRRPALFRHSISCRIRLYTIEKASKPRDRPSG